MVMDEALFGAYNIYIYPRARISPNNSRQSHPLLDQHVMVVVPQLNGRFGSMEFVTRLDKSTIQSKEKMRKSTFASLTR